MLQVIGNIAVVLVGITVLAGLLASIWRWGGQAEILAVIGEAMLLSRGGSRTERDR
jgi:hypothetical protein